LINCEFTFDGTTTNEWIDCIDAAKSYEITNCTVNGVAYTADNAATFTQIFSRNNAVVKINGVDTAFGAAAAKGVSTSIAANDNLITARPIHTWKSAVDTWQGGADGKFEELYDALTWQTFGS
jgi:hypothetical protein